MHIKHVPAHNLPLWVIKWQRWMEEDMEQNARKEAIWVHCFVALHPFQLLESAWDSGSTQIKSTSSAKRREKFVLEVYREKIEWCGKYFCWDILELQWISDSPGGHVKVPAPWISGLTCGQATLTEMASSLPEQLCPNSPGHILRYSQVPHLFCLQLRMCPKTFPAEMIAAWNQTFPDLGSNLLLLPAKAGSLSSAPDSSSQGRLEGTRFVVCACSPVCWQKTKSWIWNQECKNQSNTKVTKK